MFWSMVSTTDSAEPILTDKECSLTLTYSHEKTVFENVNVKLYKIAVVTSDYQYTLSPAFKDSALNLNGIKSVGEWNIVRSTLETYIVANKIEADFNAVTNKLGNAEFEALKTGMYFTLTEQIVKDDYTYFFDSALVELPKLGLDGVWQYNVAVNLKSEFLPPIEPDEVKEFKILKLWKGDNDSIRPEKIEAEILHNGKSYKKVTLSKDNNWSYSWTTQDDGAIWKVIERNVPSGYVATVYDRDNSFVLTNTFEDGDERPPTPQTGDTSNVMLYVILMIVSGVMMIILGIMRKRTRV